MSDTLEQRLREAAESLREACEGWPTPNHYTDALDVLLRRLSELEQALSRAAFVAEHLMQMIDQETWRASGGDDGQGHYEGDYRADQTMQEIASWAVLSREGNE